MLGLAKALPMKLHALSSRRHLVLSDERGPRIAQSVLMKLPRDWGNLQDRFRRLQSVGVGEWQL
jgi:hypothetical protein